MRAAVLQNPVILKEMRARMRGSRAFVIITVYLLLLSIAVALVYLAYQSSAAIGPGSVQDRRTFGKTLFGVVVWMELMTISLIAPALTAGAISSERERQTYDLLRVTLLSAPALVGGKFLSGLLYVLLLLFAALPVQSLALLFGGVSLIENLGATLILVTTAIAFCAAGVFFSSFLSRTLVSTVLAYGLATLMTFGAPLMIIFLTFLFGASIFNGFNQVSAAMEHLLFTGGWIVVSLNPLAAAIASEAALLGGEGAFWVGVPLSSGATISGPSPWILYVIIYLALSALLLWAAVRFVRRRER